MGHKRAVPFSVSKINILLSLFILILWIVIGVNFIYEYRCLFFSDWWNFYNALLLFLVVSAALLFFLGRTGKGHGDTFLKLTYILTNVDCRKRRRVMMILSN